MRIAILFLLVISSSLLFCQQGTPDPTFNPNDIGFGNGDGADYYVYAMAVQPDGKIVIGGFFTTYNGTSRQCIARLNTDGTLDESFNAWANDYIYAVGVQSTGKIIVAGGFTNFNSTISSYIIRLNTDGSIDNTFNIGLAANAYVRCLAIQSDDKIVIGGNFTTFNGTSRTRVARLNADGSLDTSFDPGAGANDVVNSLALQSDGKIIIGGKFTTYNGTSRNRIARLNSNGSLDTGFNPGTGFNGHVYALGVQTDGKIVAGGENISQYNGTSRNGIVRINTDGSIDGSFNTGSGTGTGTGQVYALDIQPDGKVIIGGFFTVYDGTTVNRICRLTTLGNLDATFDVGSGTNSPVRVVKVLANNKVLIAGDFISYNQVVRGGIVSVNTDGSFDTAFNTGSGANNKANAIVLQDDGKIIIAGDFTLFNGHICKFITRLNADGEVDSNFDTGTGASTVIKALALQDDGKIIIAGNFSSFNGISRNRIARLNADGSLDMSFDPGIGGNSGINAVAIQSDGKIIIVGAFTNYNGTSVNRIARLNTNGSLDATFNVGTGLQSTVNAVAVQSDGKIIAAGSFSNYNMIARNRIVRINSDGSIDNSFNPGSGANNYISTTALQPDGKIIIGGGFTAYNGQTTNYVARLNNDGSLDNSFNTGSGPNSIVFTSAIQKDGKIIIGGNFSTYNGTPRSFITRINADGSIDNTFNVGSGTNGVLYASAIQEDNKILISGNFTSYNGTGRNRIARLIGCTPTNSFISIDACETYTAPDNQIYTTSGLKTAIITNAEGCDSTITIDLTIHQNYLFETNETICSADTLVWRGQSISLPGVYYDSLLSQNNCDSVYVLHLSTIPADTYYLDFDGDGFGDPDNMKYACSLPAGYSTNNLDCNDNNYNINPNAYEVCDGVDNDCNGLIDSDDPGLAKPLCEKQMGVCAGALKPASLCVGGAWLPCNDMAYSGHSPQYSQTDITCDNTDNDCDGSYDEDSETYMFQDFIDICDGEIVLWRGQYYTQTGIYWDSLQTLYACDSIYVLNLTVNPVFEFSQNEAICNGETFTWRGNNYTNQGTYYDSLTTVHGCDSVFILNLTVNPTFEFTENAAVCAGDTYTWRGQNYTVQGIYYDSLSTVHGCDSVYVLHLTVNPVYEFTQNESICFGELFNWRGNNYSLAGTYYDSLITQHGCDSVYILSLSVNPVYEFSQNEAICNGETFTWRGNGYTNQGTYYDSLNTVHGCDSVYVLNLTVNPTFEFSGNAAVCAGDTYTWRGQNYTLQGIYYDSLSTVHGCDSVYVLHLTVNPVYEFTQNESICFGELFNWRGNNYSVAGTYYDSLTTQYGCDSVYVLTLAVNPVFEFSHNEVICNGETFAWRGNAYTNQGTYYDSLTTVHGCDSVYVLNLTVHPTFEFTENASVCFGDTLQWRGNYYQMAGVYYDSLTTQYGCDSVYVLNFTVNPFYYIVEPVSVCAGTPYLWHGQTYTLPGVYYDSLIAVSGCDSVYVLNLSHWSAYHNVTTDTICAGDTYYWRGNYYSATGTYNEPFSSQNGCDSIYTLELNLRDLPVVSISGAQALYCVYNAPVTLSGTPTGGVFSGQGMAGSIFSPTTAGIGNWMIVYAYSDPYGCFNTDTIFISIDACVGVNMHESMQIKLYPNPNDGYFTLELDDEALITIYSAIGNVIFERVLTKGSNKLNLSYLPAGLYSIKANIRLESRVLKFIIE